MGTFGEIAEPQLARRDEVITVRRREHIFYTAMAIAAIAVAATGFSGTINRELAGTGKLSTLVHVHAAVAATWLFLFLVQVRLIASSNVWFHRRLGAFGATIAVGHVLIGYLTATAAAGRGFDLSGRSDPIGFMIFPLGDLLAFAILVSAAFSFRRHAAAHKRLMFLTVSTTLGAPFTHFIAETPALAAIPNVIVPPLMIFWFGNAAFDRLALGRFHPVSLWGGLALFVWGNLRAIVLQPSDAWHDFGSWLIG